MQPKPAKAMRKLKRALIDARDYASWAQAGSALDQRSGRDRWKARERSNLYDYATLRERLDRLCQLRQQDDTAGLVRAIEEGVHGNLGGMGSPILYSKAYFGTKQLIVDYVDAVVETLLHLEQLPEDALSAPAKLDLFRRARRCYGRSALLFSSGGALVYFHFGVAKCLLEQGVLPEVLSGSSAGAMVAAVLGCHTDAELEGFFTPQNICFGEAWQPNRFERITGLRRIFDIDAFEHTFERMIPDLTFREALEHSGRNISISVSPCERHHSPRLLNAITSPHVLIRSAVRASCAIPGLFEPVQLLARSPSGETVPYLSSRWIDGLFAADLPARQLARLYGTNHSIVSVINPILLPTFRDQKLNKSRFRPVLRMLKNVARDQLKATDVVIGKYLPASSLGLVNKLLHDVLSQDYAGDISIAPPQRFVSPLKLISPRSETEIAELMLEGERQTWPRVELLRESSKISRTLGQILLRAGDTTHGGF